MVNPNCSSLCFKQCSKDGDGDWKIYRMAEKRKRRTRRAKQNMYAPTGTSLWSGKTVLPCIKDELIAVDVDPEDGAAIEETEIVREFLSVNKCLRKANYLMSHDKNLCIKGLMSKDELSINAQQIMEEKGIHAMSSDEWKIYREQERSNYGCNQTV